MGRLRPDLNKPDRPLCRGCDLPIPSEHCWENRWDCWARYPPRNLTTQQLWERIKDLESKIETLEWRLDQVE